MDAWTGHCDYFLSDNKSGYSGEAQGSHHHAGRLMVLTDGDGAGFEK